jgi:hypothetical protein
MCKKCLWDCKNIPYLTAEVFIDQVRKLKPAAASYIEQIDGLWNKNTSWLDENMKLPPRYGIITSNTSISTIGKLLVGQK